MCEGCLERFAGCLAGSRVVADRNDGLPLADVLMGNRAEAIPLGGKPHEDLVENGIRARIRPRAGKSLGLDPYDLGRQPGQHAGNIASRECRIHPADHVELALHFLVSFVRCLRIRIVFAMTSGHDHSSGLLASASGIDVLSDMLRSVRLTGAMLFLVEASTPWVSWAPQAEAFRRVVLPAAQHLISLHIVTHGSCWAGLTGAPSERLDTGDVLLVPHGDAYYLADPPEAERTYGHDEAVAFFRDMAVGKLPPTVIEGGHGPGKSQFICGFLGCDLRPFNPLLSTLPRLLCVRAPHSGTACRI